MKGVLIMKMSITGILNGENISINGTPEECADFIIDMHNRIKESDNDDGLFKGEEFPSISKCVPDKKTINDIWDEMIKEMPDKFSKTGIGKYSTPIKTVGYARIELKTDEIALSIPEPISSHDIKIYKKVSEVWSLDINMSLISELINDRFDDKEVIDFLIKNFT